MELAAIISKLLSLGIIAGSCLLKIPQILKIFQQKDVSGLSKSSLYLDVYSTGVTIVYNLRMNYPLLSYGENISLLIQNIVLVFCYWKFIQPSMKNLKKDDESKNEYDNELKKFQSKLSKEKIFIILFLFLIFFYSYQFLSLKYLYILPTSCFPSLILSRISQIFITFQQKNGKSLSEITLTLTLVGALVRIFTTYNEIGNDFSLLFGHFISAFLTLILLLQVSIIILFILYSYSIYYLLLSLSLALSLSFYLSCY